MSWNGIFRKIAQKLISTFPSSTSSSPDQTTTDSSHYNDETSNLIKI